MKKTPVQILTTLLIILLCSEKVISQCTDSIPYMFVERATGDERAKEFSDNRLFHTSKHKRISDKCKIQTNPFAFQYSLKAMDDLLNKRITEDLIRLYFAFCKTSNNPNIEDSSLVLLFADNSKVPSSYYLITTEDTVELLKQSDAEKWICDFDKEIQPELKKTIDKNDPDNHPKDGDTSDTKSIVYCRKDMIDGFLNEPIHQRRHNINIVAFGVQLSAYTKKGKEEHQREYKKRLFVQFEYLKRTIRGIEIFHIEDNRDDYDCRPKKKDSHCIGLDKFIDKNKAIDNGQLCPTNCPK